MKKISFLILVMLCVFNSVFAQESNEDTVAVAFINGEPIVLREFMLIARRNRSEVIRYFRVNYNYEYDEGFWFISENGKSPADVLKEKTMDTMLTIKVLQILAKDLGIITDISYAAFLESLDTENRRRLEAKSANKVIYGPVQYSEEVYYSYLFSNMVINLKSILNERDFSIPNEKLKAEYEIFKDSLCRKGFRTDAYQVEVRYKSGANEIESAAFKRKAFETTSVLRERIMQDASEIEKDDEMVFNDPDFLYNVSDLVFNDSIPSPEDEEGVRILARETVKNMHAGECSPVIDYQGNYYIFLVKDKISLGYCSAERCTGRIREFLTTKLYDQYILDLKQRAVVDVNKEVYRSIRF